MAPPPQALTDQQLWALDTQGYVVCPTVLTDAEIAAAAEGGEGLSALADHPVIQRYAGLLCSSPKTDAGQLEPDPVAKLDRAPHLLRSVEQPTRLFGGNGRRDMARAYFHLHGWDRWTGHNAGRKTPMAGTDGTPELELDPRNGFVGQQEVRVQITQGLLVVVALDDAPLGAGGFVLVPCSHNSEVDTPAALRDAQHDRLGMLRQPELRRGDVLLVFSSTLHGLRPWQAQHPQLLAMMEFISSSAPPSEPPEPDEMPPWVAELSEEERAIVWPYNSSDVAVSDGEQLRLMSGEEVQAQPSLAQPSLYKLAEPDERLMDHEEAFMFDTLGYLLLRGVMDAEWLSAAREAIAAHETDGVTGDGYTDPTQSEALRGVPGVSQRVYNGGSTVALPEPHCFPFRKMMTHPGIMSRLQWMLGAGFRCSNNGGMLASAVGSHGQFMHSGNTNPTDEGHTFRMQNGRVLMSTSVNVEWVLTDAPAGAGGFIVSAGSHRAHYPPPHGMRKAEVMSTVEQLPMFAGDVLLFLGASVTHGALPWRREEEPRRVALFAYSTRSFAGAGRPFEGARL